MSGRFLWMAIVLLGTVAVTAGWCWAQQAGEDPFSVKPEETKAAPKPDPADPFSDASEQTAEPPTEPAPADPFGEAPEAPDPPKPIKVVDLKPAPPKPLGEREAAIEKALKQNAELRLPPATPLSDVVDFISGEHGIPIFIDHRALGDVGVDTDTPITADLANISLGSALDLVLGELGLTWTIRSEVLFITTEEEAGSESMMSTRVYDVADLVTFQDSKGDLWEDFCTLLDTITSTVSPTTWDEVGGSGSMAPGTFGAARVLVISQTDRTHREIVDLLAQLRAVAAAHASGDNPPRKEQPPKWEPIQAWPVDRQTLPGGQGKGGTSGAGGGGGMGGRMGGGIM